MRQSVAKTYKLFIGGAFPRTESGRYLVARSNRGRHLANYCHASRKDLRDAVAAARRAFAGWSAASAHLRGQILYRVAEMLESRGEAFVMELALSTGCKASVARGEIASTVDRLVCFAGWADKFGQVFSAVNPVATPHFNFSYPEPTGVVAIIAPDKPCLLAAVTLMAAAVVSGNTCILITSDRHPLPALSFAEVLATSDVPGGVVNVLSGKRSELAPHVASHMDIDAISDGSGDQAQRGILREGSAANMKRFAPWDLVSARDWSGPDAESPYHILATTETKTAWHPMGM